MLDHLLRRVIGGGPHIIRTPVAGHQSVARSV
jgi:hypothetical protein